MAINPEARGVLTWTKRRMPRRRFVAATGSSLLALAAASCGGGGAATPTVEAPGQPATPTAVTGATPTPATTAEPATTPTEATAGEPVRGGTLIYARNIDAKTLDPHFSAQVSERFALYCIYNTIVRWDPEFNVLPELAESWDISDDGTVITFHIRPGVTFHDGTDCDAEAVKWNLERILDPDVNSPQRGQLEAIDRVEALDKTTVRVTLKRPWRPLLAALGERPGFVVSPAAVEQYGENFGRNPIGSGPFRLVEWVDDSHIILERFDGYWDTGKPYLDRIEIRHVPDIQVRATMLRTGEAHLIDEVDPSVVSTLGGAAGVAVEEYKSWRWYGTQCDVDKPPFDNPDLRKALAYATDREAIKKLIFNDTGRVMTHPIAGGWAYDPSLDNLMRFDLEKAREHLARAGVAGQTFTLTASNSRLEQDLAQVLQAQYQELGINVQIETVDSAEAFQLVKEDKTNWTITNWRPRADPDGLLRILWHSQGFQNTTGFSNPEVDRLLDEAAATYDTQKAAELYHQIERIIVEDAHYVFIHASAVFAARRENVMGFVYYPDLIMRLRDLWLS